MIWFVLHVCYHLLVLPEWWFWTFLDSELQHIQGSRGTPTTPLDEKGYPLPPLMKLVYPLAWPLGETGVRSPTTHLDEIGIPLPLKHRNQNGGNNIFARMRWERCRVTSVHNKFLLNNILIEAKSSRFSMSLPLFCLPWKVNKLRVRHSEVDKIQNDLVSYSIHSIKTYLNQLPWTCPLLTPCKRKLVHPFLLDTASFNYIQWVTHSLDNGYSTTASKCMCIADRDRLMIRSQLLSIASLKLMGTVGDLVSTVSHLHSCIYTYQGSYSNFV